MSIDRGNFDLRLFRDLLDSSGANAPDLPGNHARVRVGFKSLDGLRAPLRRKSFCFSYHHRRKPYVRLFSYRAHGSRMYSADFSGDGGCVRIDLSAAAIFARACGETVFRTLKPNPSLRAMEHTVSDLTPPTCLATADPFGLLCSASMICARFDSGIIARLKRRADPNTRLAPSRHSDCM